MRDEKRTSSACSQEKLQLVNHHQNYQYNREFAVTISFPILRRPAAIVSPLPAKPTWPRSGGIRVIIVIATNLRSIFLYMLVETGL